MATKKVDVLLKVYKDSMFPIRIWIDNPAKQLEEIESVEGVTRAFHSTDFPILIAVDPRYDTQKR